MLPEYFEALAIPVRSGALPDGWEVPAELPIVVNERMADAFWPDADPLGATLSMDWQPETVLRIPAQSG